MQGAPQSLTMHLRSFINNLRSIVISILTIKDVLKKGELSMIMVLLEGAVACFLLLITCVIGIANGPVNLVSLYEKEVQDRVVEKGLITREKIKRNANYFKR